MIQYFHNPIESDRETDSLTSQQPKKLLGANFRKPTEIYNRCDLEDGTAKG